MSESMSDLLLSVLKVDPVSRVRRNHGLEHATLHILAQRYPRTPMAGHSDASGYWILGDVSTEEVASAAREALQRMQGGEHSLAVHPNCGTNLVTAGVLSGGLAWLTMLSAGRREEKLDRLPLTILMATLGLAAAGPLGLFLQAHVTTSGQPEGLEIVEVVRSQNGRLVSHRVVTQG